MGAGRFPKNRKIGIFAILWSVFLRFLKIGPELKSRFSDFRGGKIGMIFMK